MSQKKDKMHSLSEDSPQICILLSLLDWKFRPRQGEMENVLSAGRLLELQLCKMCLTKQAKEPHQTGLRVPWLKASLGSHPKGEHMLVGTEELNAGSEWVDEIPTWTCTDKLGLSLDQGSLILRSRMVMLLPREECVIYIYVKGSCIVVIFNKQTKVLEWYNVETDEVVKLMSLNSGGLT
jgi:hypothetical protein